MNKTQFEQGPGFEKMEIRNAEDENKFYQQFINNEMAILNATLGRRSFMQQLDINEVDIDRDCGYPDTGSLPDYYSDFYDRHAIAARVVEVLPVESWKVQPEVYESDDSNENTEFENAWNDLSLSLRTESKFKQKEGNPIWEYLQRVDILSGIGHYGVLFLGLDDVTGEEGLRNPVSPGDRKLLFLRAFDEYSAEIKQYDINPNSTRFGLPEIYSIEFSAPEDASGRGVQSLKKEVHWSRVIHIADNIGKNEVFGIPRMRPVFNRLWDLRKLYGGSAEMYWKGAFPGLSIETNPQLGGAAQIDVEGLRTDIEKYEVGLQRYLTLRGMQAKSLAPQVVDPTPQVERQIEAICIKMGIPKRTFMGSELGELASSQDAESHEDRLKGRRRLYLTPRVIVPFVDRLIEIGVLPAPESYSARWEEKDSDTPNEKADVALKLVQAMLKYLQGDVAQLIAPVDFLTRIMNFEKEEAQQIVDTAMEAFEEEQQRQLEMEIERGNQLSGDEETGTATGVDETGELDDGNPLT